MPGSHAESSRPRTVDEELLELFASRVAPTSTRCRLFRGVSGGHVTTALSSRRSAHDPGAQVRRKERPGGSGTSAQVTGIGIQVRRNGRPGRVGTGAQVAPERVPGCGRNTQSGRCAVSAHRKVEAGRVGGVAADRDVRPAPRTRSRGAGKRNAIGRLGATVQKRRVNGRRRGRPADGALLRTLHLRAYGVGASSGKGWRERSGRARLFPQSPVATACRSPRSTSGGAS